MAKILVIEDENRMAELLKRGLEESGHTVGTATNVSEGLRMFAYEKQDIIISDIMLPDGSGFDLCRDIRRQNETVPILILTALGTTDDKLEGFDSGADDYMVKPFDFRELNARISILLKRCQIPTVECIEYADLKVYLRTVRFAKRTVHYTYTERIQLTPLFCPKPGKNPNPYRNSRKGMGHPF